MKNDLQMLIYLNTLRAEVQKLIDSGMLLENGDITVSDEYFDNVKSVLELLKPFDVGPTFVID